MSVRNTLFIGISTVVIATGASAALLPEDQHAHEQQQHQSQTEELQDSQDREHERMRESGNSHLDAELGQKNVPVEPRPAEHPHLHFRLP